MREVKTPPILCLPPTSKRLRGTFNHAGSGWRIVGAPCLIRMQRIHRSPTHPAPGFMGQLDAMRMVSSAYAPVVGRDFVAVGPRQIARAYYDAVVTAWPRVAWLVHPRAAAPVLAVAGDHIVAVVAPLASRAVAARLRRQEGRVAA